MNENGNSQKPDLNAAPATEPLVSVLLLTKNGERYLEECLKGVFSQSTNFSYEVIAVDSGSTDRTLSILSRFAVRVHAIKPSEFRHGRTRNLAAGLARGKYLVFLTQDATPANGRWLGELVRNIENTPDAAGAYSRWLCRPEGHVLEKVWIKQMFPAESRVQKIVRGEQSPDKKQSRKQIFFSNVSSCIRKAAWDKFPFDETVSLAEDQLWSKQVLEAGYSIVYASSSEVLHSHHDSWNAFIKRIFESGMEFGRMSAARKAPAAISFSEILHTIIDEGRQQGKGPLGVFLLLTDSGCRVIAGEICNRIGFLYGMFLNMLESRKAER